MSKLIKQDLDSWLDGVNYSLLNSASYIPTEFALTFMNFVKLVNGIEGESHKTPPVHLRMLDRVVESPSDYIVNLCFRGAAKTTLFMEYMSLYLGCFGYLPGHGPVSGMLYLSDSMDNGVKNARRNLEFRYNNSEFAQQMIPHAKFTDNYIEFGNQDGHLLGIKMFGAKALSLDSVLYTEDGPTTMGQVAKGDRIYGPDGKLATVLEKSDIFHKPMYALRLHDGRTLKVSEDHINSVTQLRQVTSGSDKGKMYFEDRNLTTSELLRYKLKVGSNYRFWIKATEPVQYPERELPLDSYTLGLLLGDGRIRPKNGNSEIIAHSDDWAEYVQHIPYELGKEQIDSRNTNVVTRSVRGIQTTIMALGLNVGATAKRVPHVYLYGSVGQRLAVLQGLMDTDGTIGKNGYCSFCSTSPGLAEDVAELVRSLGGLAHIQPGKGYWKVGIKINLNIFRLSRKTARMRYDTRTMARVVSIDPIEQEPSQCIAIDNEDHQYLTSGYTRTHNTGLRGSKVFGKRPTFAILDDLLSDDDASSKAAMETISDTVYKGVNHALDPTRRKVVLNGTPFHKEDIMVQAVESGGWEVNVWPVCERFPCSEEEFVGAWPDRFTYQFIKEQYDFSIATGKVAAFLQELMLRITSAEDRLIQDADCKWYSRHTLLQNKNNFNFYITTDFATSEKSKADYSVIFVWAYNSNGDWFWVDGVMERQTMDKSINDLFRLVSEYGPQQVGIEVSGQQGAFIKWLQQEQMNRNIWFPFASSKGSGEPGIRPDMDKLRRFNLVVPWFKAGKMFFPEEMKQSKVLGTLMGQYRLATVNGIKGKDDGIDGTSQLAYLQPFKPSNGTGGPTEMSGIWEQAQEQEHTPLDNYQVS